MWPVIFFSYFQLIKKLNKKKIKKTHSFSVAVVSNSLQNTISLINLFVLFFLCFSKIIDNHRILASLAFAFIIVVIGFPMWWKTTEVYRVPLPYDKINRLDTDPIRITSKIGIFTHAAVRSALLVHELNQLQQKNGMTSNGIK